MVNATGNFDLDFHTIKNKDKIYIYGNGCIPNIFNKYLSYISHENPLDKDTCKKFYTKIYTFLRLESYHIMITQYTRNLLYCDTSFHIYYKKGNKGDYAFTITSEIIKKPTPPESNITIR